MHEFLQTYSAPAIKKGFLNQAKKSIYPDSETLIEVCMAVALNINRAQYFTIQRSETGKRLVEEIIEGNYQSNSQS
jgi:hypothetical protein